MWKYIKNYLHFAILAAMFMMCEVMMDLLQPDIMRRIVDEGVLGAGAGGTGNLPLILELGVQMIAIAVFGGLCGSLNNVFVHLTGQNIGNHMRKDAFRNIMAFSFPQIDQFGTGSLVTRVTNDVTQVQHLVSNFVRGMIRTTMLTFGSIFFMFRLNRRFGMIVLCAFPFMVGCLVFCLHRGNPLFGKLQAQLDRMNAMMQEDVSGIRIIKACVREMHEKIRFGKINGDLIRTQLQVLTIFAFMNPVINMLMNLAVVAILLAGSFEVPAGAATPGDIMAAITYTTRMLHGILMLVMLFQNISRGMASWRRLKEVLHSSPELKNGSFDGNNGLRGQVEFRDVSFAYPGSRQQVLKHINLTIRPGETVAVMGATGCGKTTLVNLIPRFYDVSGGAVLVNGVDVREYDQNALRQKISIALQKSELFSASVQENIAWGKVDASMEEITGAAKIAQADGFIRALPDGYDTIVAERGMSLSGGQKQRVSISRAILKHAEIMIFDDATSALDLKTEANLYDALNAANPDCTKIIIAQRIASVHRADRIVVLAGGGIEACGTHDELLRTSSTYRDIYDSQLGEEAHDDGQ